MADRPVTVRRIVSTLASGSNVHGIARIATSRSTKRQVFWVFLVILGCAALTFQLVSHIQKYLSYPVLEVSKTIVSSRVKFPAVTVCNKNPISMEKMTDLLANNSEMMSWFDFTGQADFGEHNSMLDSNQAFYENFPEVATQLGHNYASLVLNCRFNNEECGVKNFTSFFDSRDLNNCFTFIAGYDNQEKINVLKPGPHDGLSLILSLDKLRTTPGTYGLYDLENSISYSGGIRVHIHPYNQMPAPANYGLDLPPGYSTSIGLGASSYSRLQSPYGDCTTKSLEGLPQYQNTMLACLQMCQQKILIQRCGCKSAALPIKQSDASDVNIPFCSKIKDWRSKAQAYKAGEILDLPYLTCAKQTMDLFETDRSYENDCGCSSPCEEISYEQTISMAYWPEEFYQFSLLRIMYQTGNISSGEIIEVLDTMSNIYSRYGTATNLGTGITEKYNRSDSLELSHASSIVRKNILRLNIFLKDFSVTEHSQMADYTLADLFTDIGVTMLLWLGVSVLSLMELFELIMVLILLAFGSDSYVMGDRNSYDMGDRKEGNERTDGKE